MKRTYVPETFDECVGIAVKKARRAMTQSQLADATGIENHVIIGQVERGEIGCSIGRLIAIARATDSYPSDLLDDICDLAATHHIPIPVKHRYKKGDAHA